MPVLQTAVIVRHFMKTTVNRNILCNLC